MSRKKQLCNSPERFDVSLADGGMQDPQYKSRRPPSFGVASKNGAPAHAPVPFVGPYLAAAPGFLPLMLLHEYTQLVIQ